MINNDEGKSLMQSNCNCLVDWQQRNNMNFNTAKCSVIHLRARNVGHSVRLGDCLLEGSNSEIDLRAILDNR